MDLLCFKIYWNNIRFKIYSNKIELTLELTICCNLYYNGFHNNDHARCTIMIWLFINRIENVFGYSCLKKQASVETSSFGSKFIAARKLVFDVAYILYDIHLQQMFLLLFFYHNVFRCWFLWSSSENEYQPDNHVLSQTISAVTNCSVLYVQHHNHTSFSSLIKSNLPITIPRTINLSISPVYMRTSKTK